MAPLADLDRPLAAHPLDRPLAAHRPQRLAAHPLPRRQDLPVLASFRRLPRPCRRRLRRLPVSTL